MGLRRRVHHRTQLHAFAQKGASGESSGRHDQGRRPHSPSRRLRGTTTILRVHLPKALEVPQSIARLNAGKPPTDSSDEAQSRGATVYVALAASEESVTWRCSVVPFVSDFVRTSRPPVLHLETRTVIAAPTRGITYSG